jgi:hypothetical protein
MSAQVGPVLSATTPSSVAERVAALDREGASASVDAHDNARLEQILSPDECRAVTDLYPDAGRFRGRAVMARHGYGRGEYKYFSYPLPGIVAAPRSALYRAWRPSPIGGGPRSFRCARATPCSSPYTIAPSRVPAASTGSTCGTA